MNDISYRNIVAQTDNSLIEMIGRFVKHNRITQNRSQLKVSEAANISRSTLSLLERGESVNLSSLIQVLRVLDLLYILEIFEVKETISPIQYAKLKKKKKLRASSKKKQNPKDEIEW